MKYQLIQENQRASKLEKMINDVCEDFPHCNIPTDTALPQKVCIIVFRAKDLEETIQNIDAEYKAHIAELEAKPPEMP